VRGIWAWRDRVKPWGPSAFSFLQPLPLCFTPKRCSSSTTRQDRAVEIHALGEQGVRAMDDIDTASAQAVARFHGLALADKRDSGAP